MEVADRATSDGTSTLVTFWATKERRRELRRLAEVYGLRHTEVYYLKREILEVPEEPGLSEDVVAFLATLADDTREFFMHNCPAGRWDSLRKQFEHILEDTRRIGRHVDLWERIRADTDEIRRSYTRVNSFVGSGHNRPTA